MNAIKTIWGISCELVDVLLMPVVVAMLWKSGNEGLAIFFLAVMASSAARNTRKS